MGLLRLDVLGAPEVFHDGSRLTFSLRKAQALLIYLAVEGGMHPPSKLAAFLWPDSEPPAARTGLRTTLPLLRQLFDRLSSWQEEAFELEQARATLTGWLALDPLSEEAARRLMRVHLAQGEASTALRVYATLRARLAEELQAQPSADTLALVERVRATAAASRGSRPARSSPTTIEARPPGELVAPLVGRAAAFTQLVGSFQQARQGRPQAVLVEGE